MEEARKMKIQARREKIMKKYFEEKEKLRLEHEGFKEEMRKKRLFWEKKEKEIREKRIREKEEKRIQKEELIRKRELEEKMKWEKQIIGTKYESFRWRVKRDKREKKECCLEIGSKLDETVRKLWKNLEKFDEEVTKESNVNLDKPEENVEFLIIGEIEKEGKEQLQCGDEIEEPLVSSESTDENCSDGISVIEVIGEDLYCDADSQDDYYSEPVTADFGVVSARKVNLEVDLAVKDKDSKVTGSEKIQFLDDVVDELIDIYFDEVMKISVDVPAIDVFKQGIGYRKYVKMKTIRKEHCYDFDSKWIQLLTENNMEDEVSVRMRGS